MRNSASFFHSNSKFHLDLFNMALCGKIASAVIVCFAVLHLTLGSPVSSEDHGNVSVNMKELVGTWTLLQLSRESEGMKPIGTITITTTDQSETQVVYHGYSDDKNVTYNGLYKDSKMILSKTDNFEDGADAFTVLDVDPLTYVTLISTTPSEGSNQLNGFIMFRENAEVDQMFIQKLMDNVYSSLASYEQEDSGSQ